MAFSLPLQNIREPWNEWEMRVLVLLSLFLQLTLATLVRRRKFVFRYWIHVMIWTMYLSADSIATLTLGILSSHLANIRGMKGTTNPKSQITAFWAPFLLLHLGGPDAITSYVQEDNELWLRQLARLCIQVGLACFIYFMALSGSPLSMLAAGIILVGFIKCAERTLCLYLASKDRLRDSMLVLPNFIPMFPRIMQPYTVREEEGYQVRIDEITEVQDDVTVNSGQTFRQEKAETLFIAHDLFKIFKLLFLGFIRRFGDLDVSRDIFMREDMDSLTAFGIVEIELGFMYDLLYTKAPLLNWAWGIIRWVINLSVPCAVLVFFSFQDNKDYPKVDICVTFLLISVTIFIEIYSLLLAISSDWICHRRFQGAWRSTLSSAIALLGFSPSKRWSNSVAQFSLLGMSVRKTNRIFLGCPTLAKLDEKLMISYVKYRECNSSVKEWIFWHLKHTVRDLEQDNRLKNRVASLKLEASGVLRRSNWEKLIWSMEDREFYQSILIWHIVTELHRSTDRGKRQGQMPEVARAFRMSKLVSRYMLYLILVHPSMLPTGIGVPFYKDTLVDAQKFFEAKLARKSENQGGLRWPAMKSFKKREHFHTGVGRCSKPHKSRESLHLCELCHLLRHVKSDFWDNMGSAESRSVLLDACHLASQLNEIDYKFNFSSKWELISKVWAHMLMYAACQCKGSEHCQSLSRGGELLTHAWLLMAHLGVAEAVQTFKAQPVYQLIKN